MTIEAALGAEMERHLGYAKHEQNTQNFVFDGFGFYPEKTQTCQI